MGTYFINLITNCMLYLMAGLTSIGVKFNNSVKVFNLWTSLLTQRIYILLNYGRCCLYLFIFFFCSIAYLYRRRAATWVKTRDHCLLTSWFLDSSSVGTLARSTNSSYITSIRKSSALPCVPPNSSCSSDIISGTKTMVAKNYRT